MDSRRLRRAAAFGLMLVGIGWPAGAAEDGDRALARALLEALDVPAELAALEREALVPLRAPGIEADDRPALRAIVSAGFRPSRLEAHVVDGLARHLDRARAEAALRALGRPTLRRVRASTRQTPAECPLEAAGADPERLALMHRVGDHLAVRSRARLRSAFVFAELLEAANRALPETRRLSDDEIAWIERTQRRAAAHAHAGDQRALRCRYAPLRTAELRTAARFLASPEGRWLFDAVDGALARALHDAAEATALGIVDTFGGPGRAAPLRVAQR